MRDTIQQFDKLNRVTGERSASRWHHYAYNIAGQRTAAWLDGSIDTASPASGLNARCTLFYSYDAAGRMVRCSEAAGSLNVDPAAGTLVTTWQYDERGLMARQYQADGCLVEQYGDPLGRLNRTTQYGVPGAGGVRPVRYAQYDMGWDGSGNLISFKEDYLEGSVLKTRSVENHYDAAGRLIEEIRDIYSEPGGSPSHTATVYTSDNGNNRLSKTVTPLGLPAQAQTWTYTLPASDDDAFNANQIKSYTRPYGWTVNFTYDANGNRAMRQVKNGANVTQQTDVYEYSARKGSRKGSGPERGQEKILDNVEGKLGNCGLTEKAQRPIGSSYPLHFP